MAIRTVQIKHPVRDMRCSKSAGHETELPSCPVSQRRPVVSSQRQPVSSQRQPVRSQRQPVSSQRKSEQRPGSQSSYVLHQKDELAHTDSRAHNGGLQQRQK